MTKTALVTGAGGGLGAAIARRLAGEGYRVALLDTDAAGLEAEAARIPGSLALRADVTDEAQIETAVAAMSEAFGDGPDVLVNNAGIVRFGDLLDHSVADFRKVVDVNLTGTFIVTRAVARRMAERGSGAIVNITSLNAVAPSPDAGAYPATKAAVALLTEHMALSFAPRGVRVNAVGPGFIDAGMSAPIYADESVREVRGGAVPARSLGTADDVADAVLFLVSDKARYIHGQHLMVDGGVSFSLKMHLPPAGAGGEALTAMIRNLILTGGIGHPFADAAPALDAVLAGAGIRSTVTEDIEGGLEDLDRGGFDLVTVYALRWRMLGSEKYAPHRDAWAFSLSPEGRERLTRFVTGGGGLIGLHTALVCFDDWPGWADLLGAAWVWGRSGHPPLGPVTLRPTGTPHPITDGLPAFTVTDEAYRDLDLAPGIVPLATVEAGEGGAWPALWAREVGRGRAVTDTIGHDRATLEHPVHQQILTRAALWAARRL